MQSPVLTFEDAYGYDLLESLCAALSPGVINGIFSRNHVRLQHGLCDSLLNDPTGRSLNHVQQVRPSGSALGSRVGGLTEITWNDCDAKL